jgi:hypothetical protein
MLAQVIAAQGTAAPNEVVAASAPGVCRFLDDHGTVIVAECKPME